MRLGQSLACCISLSRGAKAHRRDLRALCACDIITDTAHEIHLLCDVALAKLIVAQRYLVGMSANAVLT